MRIGIVEDNMDPMEEGRLKIRVCGITDQKGGDGEYLIPTAILPWARCGCIPAGGAFSVPKKGSAVYVDASDIYNPIWTGMVYTDRGTRTETGADLNAHTLIYDTDFSGGGGDNWREGEHIKVYFSENKGFVIDYATAAGRSVFSMSPDGDIRMTDGNGDSITMSNGKITIKCDNLVKIDAPKIELGSEASEGLLKSETFKKVFNTHTHLYEKGETQPPKIGMNPNAVQQKVIC